MKHNDLKQVLADLHKPTPYRTSSVAVVLLSAVAAAAILVFSILRWPALKDAGWWQLVIFVGCTLALSAIAFPVVRRIEAGNRARREARGEPDRLAETGLGTWLFATLLFGGGGVFVLWSVLAKEPIDVPALGGGLTSLVIGAACARTAWTRIRQR